MTEQTTTIEQVSDALKRGEPAIFPTDTVYGLGVSVGAVDGPGVLFDLKERDRGKPVAWLVGGIDDLDRYGSDVPTWAHAAACAFWPGPLTLVVRAGERVPAAFCSAAGTVGLRMPDNDAALALIRAAGAPLATTSANLSGRVSASSFDELDPELVRHVGAVLSDDADDGKSGLASTVVDCTGNRPAIIREGAVALGDLEALV